MNAPVPVVVIGGWLGAGKTTLVNHLLRHAGGQRIAVLVNDFGDVGIDADLIEGRLASDVLALAGGCICCAFGADLVGTLQGIATRLPAPDVVLIECSGVAHPRAVARSAALARAVTVEGVVTVLDAEQFAERLADPYVGDTVRAQLAQADLLVANKTDLADPAHLRAALAQAAPGVPVIDAVRGQVAPELVLGVRLVERAAGIPVPAAGTTLASVATRPDAAARYRSELRSWDGPVDLPALMRELSAPDARVLRAKGIVTALDGQRWVVQAVGRRVEAVPAPRGDQGPSGRLVVIRGRDGGGRG